MFHIFKVAGDRVHLSGDLIKSKVLTISHNFEYTPLEKILRRLDIKNVAFFYQQKSEKQLQEILIFDTATL